MKFRRHHHLLTHLVLQHPTRSRLEFTQHIPIESDELAHHTRRHHILSETQQQLTEIHSILSSQPELAHEDPARYERLMKVVEHLSASIEKKK